MFVIIMHKMGAWQIRSFSMNIHNSQAKRQFINIQGAAAVCIETFALLSILDLPGCRREAHLEVRR
jgi:hypothetical protein